MLSHHIASSLSQQNAISVKVRKLQSLYNAMAYACHREHLENAVELFEKATQYIREIIIDILDNCDVAFFCGKCIALTDPIIYMQEFISSEVVPIMTYESATLFNLLKTMVIEDDMNINYEELDPLGIEPKLVIPDPNMSSASPYASILVRLTNSRMELAHLILHVIFAFRNSETWNLKSSVVDIIMESISDIIDIIPHLSDIRNPEVCEYIKKSWERLQIELKEEIAEELASASSADSIDFLHCPAFALPCLIPSLNANAAKMITSH